MPEPDASPPPESPGLLAPRSLPAAPDLSESSLNQRFSQQWEAAHVSVRAFLTSFLSTRSIIDDCVQEVALLAWRKGPVDADPDRFKAFCLVCARRVAQSEIRRKYRVRNRHMLVETLARIAEAAARAEPSGSEAAERMAALRGCLGQLDDGNRQLLHLRYAADDPTALRKEAAKARLSVDAIYKKLERLRTALRNCVARKMTESNG